MNDLWRTRLVILAALVVLVALAVSMSVVVLSEEKPLVVTVTLGCLKTDVSSIGGSYVRVSWLIPPGVDAHEYSLRPEDVIVLVHSDVVVSTNHTHAELQVDRLFREGRLNASYIVINSIPGVKIQLNPSTGKPNYHMVIYDPNNYIVFIKHLARTLSSIDPEHKSFFEGRASEIVRVVERIISETPRLSGWRILVSSPGIQYAVGWLGANITMLLKPEEGLDVSPQTLSMVEKALEQEEINAVAVCVIPSNGEFKPCSKSDEYLMLLAERTGTPVIRVVWPLYPMSIPEKLEFVSREAKEALAKVGGEKAVGGVSSFYAKAPLTVVGVSGALSITALFYGLRCWRRGLRGRFRVGLMLFFALLMFSASAFGCSREAAYPLLWLGVIVSSALAFSALSPVVGARRLYFLAGALPHVALFSASSSILIAGIVGGGELFWTLLVGLVLTYVIGYALHRGAEPEAITAIFVGVTSSLSVLVLYYAVTRYVETRSVYALIIGDPLLTRFSDLCFSVALAVIVVVLVIATYRVNVYIGLNREHALLSGVRVWFYDLLFFTLLAITVTGLVRIVGFILAHVLILIPGAASSFLCRRSTDVLVLSMASGVMASSLGLLLGLSLNLSPTGITGIVLVLVYAVALVLRRAGLC